jgi:hypothetical protein
MHIKSKEFIAGISVLPFSIRKIYSFLHTKMLILIFTPSVSAVILLSTQVSIQLLMFARSSFNLRYLYFLLKQVNIFLLIDVENNHVMLLLSLYTSI